MHELKPANPVPPSQRRRWRWWKVLLLAVIIPPAIVLLTYGVMVYRFANSRPTISRNFAAELNAPIRKISPKDRAWPEYRRVVLSLRESDSEFKELSARPGWRMWAAQSEFAAQHGTELADIGAAAVRPHLGFLLADIADWPLDQSSSPLHHREDSNPALSEIGFRLSDVLLGPATLLRVGLRAGAENDAATATKNLLAMIHLGSQVQAQHCLMQMQPFGGGILKMACSAIVEFESCFPAVLSESDLQSLQLALVHAHANVAAVDLEIYRFQFEDHMQRYFSDDGHGNGAITVDGLIGLRSDGERSSVPSGERWWMALKLAWAPWVMASREEQTDKFKDCLDRAERAYSIPMWEWEEIIDFTKREETVSSAWTRVRVTPALTMASIVPSLFQFDQRMAMAREGTLAVLAVLRFERKFHRWPATLGELVPEFLSEVPLDRFDGLPLKYRIVNGQPRVYGVGTNLKDDGGVDDASDEDHGAEFIPRSQLAEEQQLGLHARPGDWMFWPPVLPNEPSAGEPANHDADP